mmetsp:Transcript_39565/g.54936  ORF Transcript_39565/g.54936 Transcript_39565/m.54936 type:complete len:274 (-) Transcript_39565:145-966(-)|eukprot:CAMPEP_0196589440 /NCGR_PEP_ID=MMETSP1081-20130531/63540_1 /TAXON_ID=36882 /ORGANISM="Pyramimonas amylifera, Strain CCMP720" /LENGTH=273 /DNA_ID=CAMNT_0041912239 /DNA_START=122 /DNA_END=943 /DNA_ORIENTATION=-
MHKSHTEKKEVHDSEDVEKALVEIEEIKTPTKTSPPSSKRFMFSNAHSDAKKVLHALSTMMSSWASKKFMTGCAILLPISVTVYVTLWFLTFFDKFFSPVFHILFGFNVFGLGFITSMAFIFLTGVFASSWLGGVFLYIGEWFIHKLPIVKHVYSASKQISQALNPSDNAPAFRECVLIRHPRQGEYAFAFITGECLFQKEDGEVTLYSVFVPTNHIYVGDIFLVGSEDIFRTTMTVREGIEIVVSGGMALPATIVPLDRKMTPSNSTASLRC